MKYLLSLTITVTIAMAAMFLFPPAPARAVGPVFDMGLLTNTVSQDHNVKSQQQRLVAPRERFLTAAPGAAPVLPASTLRYRPSLDQRRANLASFVEKTRRTDPASAATMQRDFAAKDVVGEIARAIAPYNLDVTNLGDAYAYWWLTAWSGVHDPGIDFTQAQIDGIRNQSAQAMLAIPEFGRLTNAQKQELAEIYLIQAAQISATVARHLGDPAGLAKVQQAIRQGAAKSGMDLDTMVLTDSGFGPR